jgi:hypothetical protein
VTDKCANCDGDAKITSQDERFCVKCACVLVAYHLAILAELHAQLGPVGPIKKGTDE